jgi:hypothetical protein
MEQKGLIACQRRYSRRTCLLSVLDEEDDFDFVGDENRFEASKKIIFS